MHRPTGFLASTFAFALAISAFLYPLLGTSAGNANSAHQADAPLVGAVFGTSAILIVASQLRAKKMNVAIVALLATVAALSSILRIVDLPAGGNAMFFFTLLCAAAYGWRFGLVLGALSMATSALITAGVGPWLPYQMMAAAAIGALGGAVGAWTKRFPARLEGLLLALLGAFSAFVYGALMTLWFWPYVQDGSALSYEKSLPLAESSQRFFRFYVSTSFAWDLVGAFANFAIILWLAPRLLRTLRHHKARLYPKVEFVGSASYALEQVD